jgi:hypothetical protein
MSWPAHSYNAEMEARLGIWVNQGLPGPVRSLNRTMRLFPLPARTQIDCSMALRAVRENPVAVPGANATECPSMTTSFKQFIADEAGATAIKYGLIAAAFRSRSLPS